MIDFPIHRNSNRNYPENQNPVHILKWFKQAPTLGYSVRVSYFHSTAGAALAAWASTKELGCRSILFELCDG
jgi:hypothetical protein